MLGTYIEIILYPVKKYLEMLTDSVLKSHLGVSVLGIAVTCAISLILVNALVYRINVGYAFDNSIKGLADQKKSNIDTIDRVDVGHLLNSPDRPLLGESLFDRVYRNSFNRRK